MTTLTESYAFSTNGIAVNNDVYVIKYGKEISIDEMKKIEGSYTVTVDDDEAVAFEEEIK